MAKQIIRSPLLVCCGLLLALASCMQPTRAGNSQVSLETLCSDKQQQLQLTKISQARNLIEESQTRQVASCNKYKDSLVSLDQILAVVQTGSICNLSLVDKIRQYHQKFIDSSSDENKAHREAIPKTLRHFFISLCFQISAECKMALINNLEYDTKEKISEEDYAQIQFLENYGATLLDAEGEIADFDDVLLLDDLNVASNIEQETGESKMLIKVKTSDILSKLINNCNNKFKPFYDKLIMPLIKLSNLGYNYQGELLERELEELKHNKLVRRWYNIVQTCEVFRNIEVFEDPEMASMRTQDQRQMLTFIGKDEAALLRQRHVTPLGESKDGNAASSNSVKPAHQLITYEPIASHNDDELWIKDQRELVKLVNKYKASASEADRVRNKILKKMLAKIKETLMSGKIFLFANDLVKGSSGPAVTTTSVNEDILSMMDEAVEQQEIDAGLAPQEPSDGAVSGGGKRAAYGVVSKLGPTSRVKNMGIPARGKYIRAHTDGTKTSKKWYNFSMKLLPNKMSIFMWIIGIVGLLLILSVVIMG